MKHSSIQFRDRRTLTYDKQSVNKFKTQNSNAQQNIITERRTLN